MLRPNLRNGLALLLVIVLPALARAGDRVPGDQWMRYVDPADAGFDPAMLEAARATWEELPSSAFLVVADGAVVAAWGEVERRFMCHSVRKSFLSALYGIYWDRGEIDLNKNLADLGIDDEPLALLETEKRARILDLLKARSGVFHPAAYAGRTDSRDRGSQGPGRFFAYNNWDFNTLATILEQETGEGVFEAYDEHFGRPLGMQDWRISDGYYHFERDKSRYPAYPFRMSARDAARFGLLFARDGRWGEERILSRHWVRRSSALYSIDDDTFGYGFMWWVFREPRFARHGMFAAFGVGNQMIAALPDIDLVIVNRADTYQGEGTPGDPLRDLIAQVLEARTGTPSSSPELVPLEDSPPPPETLEFVKDELGGWVGSWPWPPPSLGGNPEFEIEIRVEEDHLSFFSPDDGRFALYPQSDGTLFAEDSHRRYLPVRDASGRLEGITLEQEVVRAAIVAAAQGQDERAQDILAIAGSEQSLPVEVGRLMVDLIRGEDEHVPEGLAALAAGDSAFEVEMAVNRHGYGMMGAEDLERATRVFEINTELFPEASNTWDSLGEAQMEAGDFESAIASYRRSLELDDGNDNARRRIARMEEGPVEEQEEGITAWMEKARIPGLTRAVIADGEIQSLDYLGVRDAESRAEFGEETLFEAASLSKPVFATLVLRLVERGEFDLDRPLADLLPYERLEHDARYRALTGRMVLSHRTGLPNWGGERLELAAYPGTRFGYSGEGYVYLQKVLEKVTGLNLDELARREVFAPLGMKRSRFSLKEGENEVLARPHDGAGRAQAKNLEVEANAAASLHTTAAEYARFVTAWMGGELLEADTLRRALLPAVGMAWSTTNLEQPPEIVRRIAWGLGWGLQLPENGSESEPIAWHWGDNGSFKAFVAFQPLRRHGVVYFANADRGLAIADELVSKVVGDMEPTFRWLDYESHDEPGFVERIVADTAAAEGRFQDAIEAYRSALAADPDDEGSEQRIDWLGELVEALENPVEIAEGILAGYSGNYGPRQLSWRDGELFYQREGRPEYRLFALSDRLFALDGLPDFRLEVRTDDQGRAEALVGHYLGGLQDVSPRDEPSASP